MFMYDPDLAKFGNAVSPIVPVDNDRYAQLASQRPFADRYNPRYDQPDATDWLMMALADNRPRRRDGLLPPWALAEPDYEAYWRGKTSCDTCPSGAEPDGDTCVGAGASGDTSSSRSQRIDATQALWQRIDAVLKSTFGWTPSNMSGSARWYPPLTDGAFLDAVDAFRSAGASCDGDAPKVTCSWGGAKFVLVHDPEGSLRVFITDWGPFGATTRTSGAFQAIEEKTGIGLGTLAAIGAIAGTAALLAARNPKHMGAIGVIGVGGVALALGLNAMTYGAR